MTTTPDVLEQLASQLVGAMPDLDDDGRRIASACYHLLAESRPVDTADIAARTGIEQPQVQAVLSGWPGVFTDDDGRLVGFWGLALPEMAHRFEVDGHTLYAWCAWDALFLPPILQRAAQVTSTCPTSGTTIRLTVDPDRGVVDVDPPTTVLSFLRPDRSFDEDVVASFCHYVHFFASPDAARDWTSEHPGTFVLDLGDAFRLGLAHPVHHPDRSTATRPAPQGGTS